MPATPECRHVPVQCVLVLALAASDRGAVVECSYAASSSATPFRSIGSSLNQNLFDVCGRNATLQPSSQSITNQQLVRLIPTLAEPSTSTANSTSAYSSISGGSVPHERLCRLCLPTGHAGARTNGGRLRPPRPLGHLQELQQLRFHHWRCRCGIRSVARLGVHSDRQHQSRATVRAQEPQRLPTSQPRQR